VSRPERLGTLWGRLRGKRHRADAAVPGAVPPQIHWSTLGERGRHGMGLLFFAYRLWGRRLVKFCLYFVIGYFFVTGRHQRRASRQYLARVYEYTRSRPVLPRAPGWLDSYRHMFAFGEACADKVLAWLGHVGRDEVTFADRKDFIRLMESGQGALIIGSHLGNLEMSRALTADLGKFNAVVYADHSRYFNSVLDRVNCQRPLHAIPVSALGPDTAIMLKERIERGEMLVIVGDRTPPSDNGRVCCVDFLGHPAPFAQGPFILASLLACPVYVVFCLREADGYHAYFELFAERVVLPRRRREEALRAYIQEYAMRLEGMCLRAPYQWFNFYDFWRCPAASNSGQERARGIARRPRQIPVSQ